MGLYSIYISTDTQVNPEVKKLLKYINKQIINSKEIKIVFESGMLELISQNYKKRLKIT